jgi:hypothetical protein
MRQQQQVWGWALPLFPLLTHGRGLSRCLDLHRHWIRAPEPSVGERPSLTVLGWIVPSRTHVHLATRPTSISSYARTAKKRIEGSAGRPHVASRKEAPGLGHLDRGGSARSRGAL